MLDVGCPHEHHAEDNTHGVRQTGLAPARSRPEDLNRSYPADPLLPEDRLTQTALARNKPALLQVDMYGSCVTNARTG
jgi:hypothetical protein